MNKAGTRSTAVELQHVHCRRNTGEDDVLSDVSLRIQAGQWVCVAGRNGSGKSSLVRLINGLLPAQEGEIRVEGLRLSPDTVWQIRERVGMVFASPDDQFVGMTVAEDIAFGLENRGVDPVVMRQRVAEYADRLKVAHLLNRHPAKLSGGQKQRVAIAAVLAMQPSILIFDEAASMLDEQSKYEMLDLLRTMRKIEPYTLISVTHDADEMAAADRLVMLSGGRIVADGAPVQLLADEALLQLCGLEMPYMLQLCMELRRRGIEIGNHVEERKVLSALWAFRSKASPTAIRKQARLASDWTT